MILNSIYPSPAVPVFQVEIKKETTDYVYIEDQEGLEDKHRKETVKFFDTLQQAMDYLVKLSNKDMTY
jgi:hypothetical protein